MSGLNRIRIFISSPGDVAAERKIARDVLDQIAHEPSYVDKVVLQAIAWDNPNNSAPMIATMLPQEAVNNGLPTPDKCDIVIVIFWSRMGTPLDKTKYTKPDGEPYQSGTEWEYENAIAGAEKNGVPIVMVYRRNQELALNPDDPTFEQRLEQYRRVKKFFKNFESDEGILVRAYNTYTQPDSFRQLVAQHLRKVIDDLLKTPELLRSNADDGEANLVAWEGSPFPGLRAFTEDDAPIFFGRGSETDDLVNEVSHHRAVAIVAASGAGKSSLISAGLIPRLRANTIEGSKDWVIVHIKPGEKGVNPFESLYHKLIVAFPTLKPHALQAAQIKRDFLQSVQSDPQAFYDICEAALEELPAWAEVLIFIDQFEELFTSTVEDLRERFLDMLAIESPRVRIVLTIRADFNHLLMEHRGVAKRLRQAVFLLGKPDREALEEMVVEPAKRAHIEFEDGLINTILNDTGTHSGTLPLLAYLLDELYQLGKRNRQLTYADYQRLGRVSGAIGKRANTVFDALPADVQAAHPYVFNELVEIERHGSATRKRTTMDKFEDNETAQLLIRSLVNARLLVTDVDDENIIVEIAHEALLTNWDKFAEWIELTRDDLKLWQQGQDACREWVDNHYNEDYLWTGDQLERLKHIVTILPITLSEDERRFLGLLTVDEVIDLIREPLTSHKRRLWAGEKLNALTDQRSGVGVGAHGFPDILWMPINGGKTVLHDNTGAAITDKLTLLPFFMSKYLLTNRQFQAFIDAPDGYTNAAWWHDMDDRFIKARPKVCAYPLETNPRESITWFECVAFTRWLNATLPNSARPDILIDTDLNWEIRLPTEWEWHWAATGGREAYHYPWGTDWKIKHANTKEAQLGRVTAVGMYPQGDSPAGISDLSGNLYEWCLNGFEEPLYCGTTRHVLRGLRGGAFSNDRHECSLNHRYERNPDPQRDSIAFGMRLVYAPTYEYLVYDS